jgi:hypothetical protein
VTTERQKNIFCGGLPSKFAQELGAYLKQGAGEADPVYNVCETEFIVNAKGSSKGVTWRAEL